MVKMNEKIERITISPETPIKDVLKTMTYPGSGGFFQSGIVLITNTKHQLLGIATDGDIRRALIKGISLEEPIEKIMTKDPITFSSSLSYSEILNTIHPKVKQAQETANKLRNGTINHIILVDDNNVVVNLISFFDLWRNSEQKSNKVCVIGLGFVGLTMAVALADVGFEVTGVDNNQSIIDSVNKGEPHFHELGLVDKLKHHLGKNFVAKHIDETIEADIYIISVGTPVDDDTKIPLMDHVKSAATWVGSQLKKGDLVVLRSTVPIGTSRTIVNTILEETSSLKSGKEYGLVFAPERTVEGNALEELRTLPQVIGGLNKANTEQAADFFRQLSPKIIFVDTLEEAEFIKILNNTFRDTSFAYANEISLLASKFNINAFKIINAANDGYPRNKIPLPSPGVGGTCLKKDPYILEYTCRQAQFTPKLITASRSINEHMPQHVAKNMIEHLKKQGKKLETAKIFIIGFAFKGEPETSDVRNSSTIELLESLPKNLNLYGYDPVVSTEVIKEFGCTPASLEQGFENADVVIIMNNHQSYKKIPIYSLVKTMNTPAILFDGWNLFDGKLIQKIEGVTYTTLGSYNL